MWFIVSRGGWLSKTEKLVFLACEHTYQQQKFLQNKGPQIDIQGPIVV